MIVIGEAQKDQFLIVLSELNNEVELHKVKSRKSDK